MSRKEPGAELDITLFSDIFFPPAHSDLWKLKKGACAPGDHGTSVYDKIDQKIKVGQNTWFFLKFFSLTHFEHWKLR